MLLTVPKRRRQTMPHGVTQRSTERRQKAEG